MSMHDLPFFPGIGSTGDTGKDGVSPTISVEDISGGHRLVIVDATGRKTVDILDGADGAVGESGKDGLTTTIKIGDTIYEQINGIISLPAFASEQFVANSIDTIDIPEVPTKVSELENDAGYITAESIHSEVGVCKIHLDSIEQNATSYEYHQMERYNSIPWDRILIVTYDFIDYVADVCQVTTDTYEAFININRQPIKLRIGRADTEGKWRIIVDRMFVRDASITDIEQAVNGLASEQFVKDSIDAINIPEADLSNYYNKTETENIVNEALTGIELKEGPQGPQGEAGKDGVDGQPGKDGTNGKDGVNGKSAYEYAKDGGYSGTESEFMELLANTADKRNIALGLHSDGLLYLFIDGEPIGTGIALNNNTET